MTMDNERNNITPPTPPERPRTDLTEETPSPAPSRRRTPLSMVAVPTIVAIAFVLGMLAGGLFRGSSGSVDPQSKLAEILRHIDREYVDEIDTDSLLESVFPALLSSLDPHSTYISAEDFQAMNEGLEGSFSGIGITFNTLSDTVTVDEVLPAGPGEKVGLMPGDRIVTVDDSVIAGRKMSNEKIISMLRGPEGTKVTLGVKRNTSSSLLPFEVTRGQISVASVTSSYMIDESTGYLKVTQFGRNTYQEFFTAAMDLKSQGAERLVIDLRGNGGGYMEMAILMANEFLSEGEPIVSTRGRLNPMGEVSSADGTGSMQEMEVAVLLDEFSASASEIFAGAIQDNDRGLVIGRRSFGKGLVQNQIMLPDNSAIRLTIARYYTPSGRCIQKTYSRGMVDDYTTDLLNRYDRGEWFNIDSIKVDKTLRYTTSTGREVYGGGGIMPDIFVPQDTTDYTSYYLTVLDGGLLHRFAFNYNDSNRERLRQATDVNSLLRLLPDDRALLTSFAEYAETQGVAQRWVYINISADLIVNQLKALIARNALGSHAYYEVSNRYDPAVKRAVEAFNQGEGRFPIMPSN